MFPSLGLMNYPERFIALKLKNGLKTKEIIFDQCFKLPRNSTKKIKLEAPRVLQPSQTEATNDNQNARTLSNFLRYDTPYPEKVKSKLHKNITFIPYFSEKAVFFPMRERGGRDFQAPRLCRCVVLSRDCHAKSKNIWYACSGAPRIRLGPRRPMVSQH